MGKEIKKCGLCDLEPGREAEVLNYTPFNFQVGISLEYDKYDKIFVLHIEDHAIKVNYCPECGIKLVNKL